MAEDLGRATRVGARAVGVTIAGLSLFVYAASLALGTLDAVRRKQFILRQAQDERLDGKRKIVEIFGPRPLGRGG